MILVSSLAARAPELSDYAASKRAGEGAALEVLGPRLTVFRPPAIYGPGDRETLGLFRLAARSPVLPLPGRPEARLALAHVDDVAGVIADLAARESSPGAVSFGGARPSGYDWREIMTQASQAVGRRSHLVSIPRSLLTAAAALSGASARLIGRPAIFTPGKARELLHGDWSVSPEEAAGVVREGAIDLREGFASTAEWYRGRGWL
jgi:nucleoside-diphosphate-sugar epimerase